jgi:hypothetical protein
LLAVLRSENSLGDVSNKKNSNGKHDDINTYEDKYDFNSVLISSENANITSSIIEEEGSQLKYTNSNPEVSEVGAYESTFSAAAEHIEPDSNDFKEDLATMSNTIIDESVIHDSNSAENPVGSAFIFAKSNRDNSLVTTPTAESKVEITEPSVTVRKCVCVFKGFKLNVQLIYSDHGSKLIAEFDDGNNFHSCSIISALALQLREIHQQDFESFVLEILSAAAESGAINKFNTNAI